MESENIRHGVNEEAALIAAVLRKPVLFQEVSEIIAPSDFGWRAYGDAWAAIARANENGMTADTVIVGDELERVGKLATFQQHDSAIHQGRAALSELRKNGVPENAKDYAAVVLDYSAKRKFYQMFATGQEWAANGRRAHDIAADMERLLAEVRTSNNKASKHTQTLKDAIMQAYDGTEAASQGKVKYIKTGYIDLDEIISGLMAPDLVLVAGRPGNGKTALLASIAMNVAEQGKRVAFFSLEMGNKQIAMRFISMVSGISYHKQLTGKLSDEDWPLYTHAIEKLGSTDYKIILNDMPDISPKRMAQELRRMGDVDLIIVDYIQLASADKKADNRVLEVGEISRGFKRICKDFDVPMIAAAQLSRAIEQRSDKTPQLSDLRESGSLEQDSDKVIFIHRPDEFGNTTDLIVGKQRNGPLGRCTLLYRGERTRFDNYQKPAAARVPQSRGA